MHISKGATIWARKTIDSEIFYNKPDKYFKIWFYLVNRVNHKKQRKWNRSECHLTYSEIEEKTGATKSQIDHCIRYLKKEEMLATKKATRGMHIKIANYNKYQDLNNYKSDSKSETKVMQKRNKSDTINKNDNNDKNEKESIGAKAPLKKEVKLVKELKISEIKINEAIKILSPLNPDWNTWYKPGPMRTSVSKLLKFCMEDGNDLKKLVDKSIANHGKQYEVQIFNPCDMVEKYAKLNTVKKKVGNSIIQSYDKRDPSRYQNKKPVTVINN